MRRTDLEVTDRKHMREILEDCPLVHLGLSDGSEPYVIPMNFGVEMDEQTCVFYFHCAREGRKLDIMAKNPRVCVEATIYTPRPRSGAGSAESCCGREDADRSGEAGGNGHRGHRGLRYQCVVATGTATILEDEAERRAALSALRRHNGRPDREESAERLARLCLFKVVADTITCKERG